MHVPEILRMVLGYQRKETLRIIIAAGELQKITEFWVILSRVATARGTSGYR